MNRIVLIGNGFDLAHGLKTSYADFIYWYWKRKVSRLYDVKSTTSDDILCTLEIVGEDWSIYYFQHSMSINNSDGKTLYQYFNKHKDKFVIRHTTFFGNIHAVEFFYKIAFAKDGTNYSKTTAWNDSFISEFYANASHKTPPKV